MSFSVVDVVHVSVCIYVFGINNSITTTAANAQTTKTINTINGSSISIEAEIAVATPTLATVEPTTPPIIITTTTTTTNTLTTSTVEATAAVKSPLFTFTANTKSNTTLTASLAKLIPSSTTTNTAATSTTTASIAPARSSQSTTSIFSSASFLDLFR